jgi:hypothetical protein
MTAEIVVMNQSAVAMAADSAVTVSGRGQTKTYKSANKLFMLTRRDPVAVMIYGAAQFLGMPWETIIKDFRDSPAATSAAHLPDYAAALIRYVGMASHLFDEATCRNAAISHVEGYFAHIRSVIEKAVEERLRKDGKIDTSQVGPLTRQVVMRHVMEVDARPVLDGVQSRDHVTFARALARPFDEAAGRVFEQLPMSVDTKRRLRHLGISLLLRQGPWPENALTGVVVAGFGAQDYFPASCLFEPRTCLAGRLYHPAVQTQTISRETPAVVQAFAQHEMVRTFLEGIDPRFKQAVVAWVERLVNGLAASVSELGHAAGTVTSDLIKHLDQLSLENFQRDVLGTVGMLPKDELAAMAESLVNLTSFKRRVTMAPESVGGPIDVAVVSKGDGLVWIKRKHYFPPELNPHFFTRYAQGGAV